MFHIWGLWLMNYRYIQLQEEYIKDEQRYAINRTVGIGIGADDL
jgi:hypothetical protein